jgi:hypothetical protein
VCWPTSRFSRNSGDVHELQDAWVSRAHSKVASGSVGDENSKLANVSTVVAAGVESSVVSGDVGGPVATTNGERLPVPPHTVVSVTVAVMSTQAVPSKWSRRTGCSAASGS